jgi:hypothetical protein
LFCSSELPNEADFGLFSFCIDVRGDKQISLSSSTTSTSSSVSWKRLCATLEKKQEIDLEQKGKSEYPGPSASLIKPDQPQLQVMSPGMILRLSYQETDDEVDVVEDDSDNSLFFIGVLFFFPSFLSFFAAKNQIIIVKIE